MAQFRISMVAYVIFIKDYYAGENGTQRLGQAFVNQFHSSKNEPYPELFYADDKKAMDIITKDHISFV